MSQIKSIYYSWLSEQNVVQLSKMYKFYLNLLGIIGITGNLLSLTLTVFPLKRPSQSYILLAAAGLACCIGSIYIGKWLIDFESRKDNRKLNEDLGKEQLKRIRKMYIFSTLNLTWLISLPIHFQLSPFLMQQYYLARYSKMSGQLLNDEVIYALIGNPLSIRILLIIPIVFIGHYCYTKTTVILTSYEKDFEERLGHYRFHESSLYRLFNPLPNDHAPVLVLGENIATKEPVELFPKDRTLNLMLIGTVGTGKTSSVILQSVYQDIHHFVKYIEDYKEISEKSDYWSKEISGTYLNGGIIIEPSNDLCQDALKVALALGVPRDMITYLNPEDEESDSINILRGPVSKVIEVVTNVVDGLAKQTEEFFKQAQRTHLKQHIFLLKISSKRHGVVPSFDDLTQMYDDVELVFNRMFDLKRHTEELKQALDREMAESRAAPNYSKKQKSRLSSLKDQYLIAKSVNEYFHKIIVTTKELYPAGHPHEGKKVHKDIEEEFVRGLKNLLSDIGNHPNMRRVLFRDTDFDIDIHFKYGGLLLVNTSSSGLGSAMASAFGKFVNLTIQEATYRRLPYVANFHFWWNDEFADYMTEDYKKYITQSRKHQILSSSAAQTLSQLGYDYGEAYKDILTTGFRNKFCFGDVNVKDAEFFEATFGEKVVYNENSNESMVDLEADQEMSRSMKMSRREKEPNITASELANLQAFTMAGRMVRDNDVEMFVKLKTKFIPNINEIKKIMDLENNDKLKASYLKLREDIRKAKVLNEMSDGDDGDIEELEQQLSSPAPSILLNEKEKHKNIVGLTIEHQKTKDETNAEFNIFKRIDEQNKSSIRKNKSSEDLFTKKVKGNELIQVPIISSTEKESPEVIANINKTTGKEKSDEIFSQIKVPKSNLLFKDSPVRVETDNQIMKMVNSKNPVSIERDNLKKRLDEAEQVLVKNIEKISIYYSDPNLNFEEKIKKIRNLRDESMIYTDLAYSDDETKQKYLENFNYVINEIKLEEENNKDRDNRETNSKEKIILDFNEFNLNEEEEKERSRLMLEMENISSDYRSTNLDQIEKDREID